jgi:DNA repair exonuclease SbcCD nuclease subunit
MNLNRIPNKFQMKIIAIGDPHFQVTNIPEVNTFIDRMEDLAKKENPDLIIILGDVLHTHERLHTTPLNKAYEFVEKMRNIAKTFVLVGNHDAINNQIFLTPDHWMNGMKQWENVTIVDTVVHRHIDKYHFVFCPYVPPGKFQEALDSNEENWKQADCIFAHQEFYGCKMGAIISVEGDKWSSELPPVVSGHIHSKQTLQEGVYYCGSSMQHAFGESDKNIIPIFTWKKAGKPYSLEEIDLELPRKKIIYTDVESMKDYVPPETEDKIKLTISGVYDDFKAFKKTKKYKELTKQGTKIVFKPKKIQVEEKEEGKEEKFEVDESDFNRILTTLISNEKSSFLHQVFELVVNNRTIEEEDILFL